MNRPTDKPAISVVIPVFNREKTVVAAVESALAQDIDDIEVICVDDASTDGSRKILDELASRDRRVRVIALSNNGGTGFARKTGILAARGEYTLCLDADDLFLPNVFARLLGKMRRCGSDIMQFRCNVSAVGSASERLVRFFQRLLDYRLPSRQSGDWRLLRDQANAASKIHWVVWNKIYRTNLLRRAAALQDDKRMVVSEDMVLTVILLSFLPSRTSTRLRCLEYRCGEGSIRETQMTPEFFDLKLNRAVCCHALLRYVDTESERLIPGFSGRNRVSDYASAPKETRLRVKWLNHLCGTLVIDRMEITWRQIPKDADDETLKIYHRRFREAFGVDLCYRFFSRAVSSLHVTESPTFRLGSLLLRPANFAVSVLRRLLRRRQ